ncbi:septation protein IspZ [Phenylobacterium sp.]|uniref:septation protein IspZ n=1 Tax=Phenylobacterium sp. TaxID=1871053 RepID=UPI0035AF38CB
MRYFTATARPIVTDLASTLVFYGVYLATGSARLGAALGLVIALAQLSVFLFRRLRPPGLLIVSIGLTLALGSLTFLTVDARFLLIKPALISLVLGVTMLPRGWVTSYVPPLARELLSDRTFDHVGWGWAALMFTSAAVNVAAVALLPPDRAAVFFTLWAVASKCALFIGQYAVLRLRAGRLYRERSAAETAPSSN